MSTRKFYVTQGEELERASEYGEALKSYLEAFNITECSVDDEPSFFSPGFIEDKIGFLAYRLGDFRTALTFGAKAYRLNPSEQRLKNNLPFYTDAILFVNPKIRLDNYVTDFLINRYPHDTTILDVGPYDGRWSDDLRSCFPNIDAVEVFEPYIEQYNLKEKYNEIFISDIREFNFTKKYGIIILGDVLEHMPIGDAQSLIEKLKQNCEILLIIIPYEYPQDEYDRNKYQIHYQEDLTDEVFMQRYPGFKLVVKDQVRGAYIFGDDKIESYIYEPTDLFPPTLEVGLQYYNNGSYSKAIGVFENSVEKMDSLNEGLKYYCSGLCHKELGNNLEAMQSFTRAVNVLPNYKEAYFELFKLLEKFELWADFEYYLKLALQHKNEACENDHKHQYWDNLLYIQLTLALTKLGKVFEAYGFATLALESEAPPERKEVAEHNYNELKKELWSTLQINA